MYSVKPGRGPSLYGAIIALVLGVPFAIFWTSSASKMGAPPFFVFFGIVFVFLIVGQAIMGIYNATSKNRISQFDVTTDKEEGDPFQRLVTGQSQDKESGASTAQRFCPYCGEPLKGEFRYCPKCGKPTSEDVRKV